MKNQKSKIKNQKYNLKLKIFFNFALLIAIFNFALLTFNSGFVFAQNLRYPIPELGNCRNKQECYLYCQIPQNTPACWSYGKYVMVAQVLGEQYEESPEETARRLGITFPIPELGNCVSPKECLEYCELPENKPACFKFAEEKGLQGQDPDKAPPSHVIAAALEELGCNDKQGCMALCSLPENHQKCRDFARKYGLEKRYESRYGRPVEEIVSIAQNELGCADKASCFKLCNRPENKDLCMDFARTHGLGKDKSRIDLEKKRQLIEAAKKELGCNNQNECMSFCSKAENHSKCIKLAQQHGLADAPETPPCTSAEECRIYCQKHPQDCPGYGQKWPQEKGNLSEPKDGLKTPISTVGGGDFIGPGGCKTEAECRSYCEKHPDECPGFPPRKEEVTEVFKDRSYQEYQPPGDFYQNKQDAK